MWCNVWQLVLVVLVILLNQSSHHTFIVSCSFRQALTV